MKKLILFLLLVIGSLTDITAQSQWFFGPKIGLGISDVSVTGLDHNFRSGIIVGALGEYRVRNFAIEADLLYASQGFKWDKTVIKENYLLIPLKAKLYVPYILKGLNVFAGPQLDLCLKRGEWIWLYPSGGDGKHKVPYRSTLASLTFGLGYRFDFGLDMAVNYNIGIISNIDDNTISDKNNVFQITVGYDLCRLFKLYK